MVRAQSGMMMAGLNWKHHSSSWASRGDCQVLITAHSESQRREKWAQRGKETAQREYSILECFMNSEWSRISSSSNQGFKKKEADADGNIALWLNAWATTTLIFTCVYTLGSHTHCCVWPLYWNTHTESCDSLCSCIKYLICKVKCRT